VTALTVAGIGLALFFVVAPQFFRHSRGLRVLSILGSVFGVISGLCFVGVGFAPANLLPEAHGRFTLTAFQAFLVAVVFYFVAVLLHPRYPKVFAFVYLAFALLLAGYVWLMISGPGFGTAQGVMIQATGQKVIVYAAILCMFVQAYGAQRLRTETGM